MAKTQKSKSPKVEWKGYLRVNLTEEQDRHFDEWRPSQVIQISDFDILCNNGFKISFVWDEFHHGVSASLFAGDVRLSWAGWVLTAWAEDVESALELLFYKHYVVCEEDWEHFTDVVERSNRKRG